MKYSELNNLWEKHHEQSLSWVKGLKYQADLLRKTVLEILEIESELWTTIDGVRHSYVEICDIFNELQPTLGLMFSDKSFTDEGELVFAIQIAFKKAPHSLPADFMWIAVAVKFIKRVPYYAFYDTRTKEINAPWEQDITRFSKTLIKKLVDYLHFDPFDGPQEKSMLGFLQS